MRRGAAELTALLAIVVMMAGCSVVPRSIEAQRGGYAVGPGGTIVQGNNAGEPSTQRSEKRTWYESTRNPASSKTETKVDSGIVATPPESPPAPVFEEQITETSLGAHQQLSPIMKAASAMDRWTWLRWVGVVTILVGIGGWLWSIGHPNGYLLVFMGVAACGVVFVLASANPAWLAILALPFGLWAVQHLGLFKHPAESK